MAVEERVGKAMNRAVIVARERMGLIDAWKLMDTKHISGMPVVASGARVVGVVSRRDIARVLAEATGVYVEPHLLDIALHLGRGASGKAVKKFRRLLDERRVADAMSRETVTCTPRTSMSEAAVLMIKHRINRLPVIEKGNLVGILSRNDLLRAI